MKLDEIARLAGVSRTTASYVINGKAKQYRVSDKTVEKVMAVVREHNYHPNAVAAGLRAGRTRSIGLVIPCRLVQHQAEGVFGFAYALAYVGQ